MGLDITVYKLIKEDEFDEETNFFNLSDNPELEVFADYIVDKTNGYYDLSDEFTRLGFDINNLDHLEWIGTEYGKNVIFEYRNKSHELYDAFLLLNEIWSAYYLTKKELFESEEFKKFLEVLPILKKYGYRPRYKFYASGNQLTFYNLVSAWKFVKNKVNFSIKNPKTYNQVDKCVGCIEVGYQRKGANSKFYEDGIWSSPNVIDEKTLMEHWEKYFSCKTPESNGAFGSEVEISLSDDEMKRRFKKNILDKFIEGETFVAYE